MQGVLRSVRSTALRVHGGVQLGEGSGRPHACARPSAMCTADAVSAAPHLRRECVVVGRGHGQRTGERWGDY